MKKSKFNIDPFLTSIKSFNKIFNKDLKDGKKSKKLRDLEFAIRFFLIFDRTGLLLVNRAVSEFSNLSIKFIDKLKLIVMRMFNIHKTSFVIIFKHLKIFAVIIRNFIFVTISSDKNDSYLIRLYLFFISVVYLNLIGDNLSNPLCLINISKIFEVFYVDCLTSKFQKIIKYLMTLREPHSIKHLYKFKSLIIYDPNNNNLIFDYRRIVYQHVHKKKYCILHNNQIFNTINKLIIQPVYNNCVIPNEGYSHKLELISTFPRWLIFGKFLRIYNGLNMIEIFSANKLSKVTNTYMEYKIEIQNDSEEYERICSKHCKKLIKAVEMFSFNYLETLFSILNKYNNPNNELLYFDLDLLRVTDDVLSLKLNQEQYINLIYKRLRIYIQNRIRRQRILDENTVLIEADESENSENKSNSDSKIINRNSDSHSEDSNLSNDFLKIKKSEIYDYIYQNKKTILSTLSFHSSEPLFNDSDVFGDQLINISYILKTNDDHSLVSFINESDFQPFSNISSEKQIYVHLQNRGSIQGMTNFIFNNNNNVNNSTYVINAVSQNSTKKISNKNVNLNARKSIPIIIAKKNENSLSKNTNIVFMNKNKRLSQLSSNTNSIIINTSKFENDCANIPHSSMRRSRYLKKMNCSRRSHSFSESLQYFNQLYSWLNHSKLNVKNKYQILKQIQYKISKDFIIVKRNNSLKSLKIKEMYIIKNSSFFASTNFNESNNNIKKIKNVNFSLNYNTNNNNNISTNNNNDKIEKGERLSENISSNDIESRTNKTKNNNCNISSIKSRSSLVSGENNALLVNNENNFAKETNTENDFIENRNEDNVSQILHEYYTDKSTNNFLVKNNENLFSKLNKISNIK